MANLVEEECLNAYRDGSPVSTRIGSGPVLKKVQGQAMTSFMEQYNKSVTSLPFTVVV